MQLPARPFLLLYPRAWRERYGEELVELAGSRVSWSVAMNIAESGIKERLNTDGYSPWRFAALGIRLLVTFVGFVSLAIGLRFVDFYLRFPDRSLPAGMAATLVRSSGVGWTAEMWLTYALFATLLAVFVNGMGWRQRSPRLMAWLVRLGVFGGLLLIVAAQELPRHFHSSPYNYYFEAYLLAAALVVGFVVESAKLGRPLDAIELSK